MAQGYSFLQPGSGVGDYNPTRFIVDQRLARVRTITLCRVMGLGTLSGTVNVQPLVSAVDSQGNAFEHGTLFSVPYFVLQSGGSAVIVVPTPGDTGILLVCDRDITSAKATLAPGPPPSNRSFDFSDALYLGGVLGPTPTQSVTVGPAGITFTDAHGNSLAMTSAGIALTSASPIVIYGNLHVTGTVTGGFGSVDQVGLLTHEHTANNTPPTPGT
jgi:hypothetical protein